MYVGKIHSFLSNWFFLGNIHTTYCLRGHCRWPIECSRKIAPCEETNMAPKKRRFCQHCQEYASTRTFREHYYLYFKRAKNEWEELESSDEESGLQTEANSNTRNTTADIDQDSDSYDDQDETRSLPGIYSTLLRR